MQTLGDYTLLKLLGEGSFGKTYLSEHRFLKKQYVVKVLPQELSADKEFITRFEKDVAVLATLDHPSIAKIHNISYADGVYFLVIEGIVDKHGGVNDLDSFLKKKGAIITEKEAENILRQIASALDYAHKIPYRNDFLIHGGIKLSNILIDESDEQFRVYLTDFGLNRIIGESRVLRDSFNRVLREMEKGAPAQIIDKAFLNNFLFLSPEQRKRDKIDVRSDVYAFGVLSYYLITRSFPEGYFELPSKVALEYKLNWDQFVLRCLHKNAQKRPTFLIEALNGLLISRDNAYNVDVLSWDEIGKKVENAMQMSFEFSSEELMKPTAVEEEEHHPKPVIKPPKIERPKYESDPGAVFQKDLQVVQYKPSDVEIKEIEPLLTEMKVIPGGHYMRGSIAGPRDEMPKHGINLTSFAIDIHCVTNEQFIRFLEIMGGEKDGNNNDIIRLKDSRIKKNNGKWMIESGYGKHPVVGVTWYGATAYAEWVGKRLPTEAEWEIASMGGMEEALYPSGVDIDHKQANFFSSDTTAVMSFPPNDFGIYDMAGNVYEWCSDWYAYNYYESSVQEPDNPKGPVQGIYRVLKGGCWKSLKEDLRCAHRHRNNPGTVNSTYGFRCAADVQ
jgi:formylglycine-generating enzyme required for sulfatase activity